MDSLVISSVNITKEDLIRISDMLQPYDVLRTEIFIQCLGNNLEPEDVRNIKERGLPDEVQIDADLYDAMYKDYEDRFKDSALQHESLFHLTGTRITKLKLNYENQVILIWNTKPLTINPINLIGGDYLNMNWCKKSTMDMMNVPLFNPNDKTVKVFNDQMLTLLDDKDSDKQDNV
mgnify:FL=1